MIQRFLRAREGGTAIEYAMIASLVAMLIITSLGSMGLTIESFFVAVNDGFSGATP
jgi:Flp pilus assembly pilin Flp